MISKFSVKKPLTVIMALFMVILLGYVSFTHMKTDLLPNMELPYIAIITPYIGATPEKVEAVLTKPLEQLIATANGAKQVRSVSAENYSLIIVEFSENTNLDSAIIEISSGMSQVTDSIDDNTVSSPIYMKINPDILPIVIASVDYDGLSRQDAAKRAEEEVIPVLERTDGVASVSATGLIENTMRIVIDEERIDELNEKIVNAIDETLADTEKELDEAQKKLDDGKAELEKTKKEQNENLAKATVAVQSGMTQLILGKTAAETAQGLIDTAYDYIGEADKLLYFAQQETENWKDYRPQINAVLLSLKNALNTAYTGICAALSQLDADCEGYSMLYSALDTLAGKLSRRLERVKEITDKINSASTPNELIQAARSLLKDLKSSVRSVKKTVAETVKTLGEQYDLLCEQMQTLESGKFTYNQQITLAEAELKSAQAKLDEGRAAFDAAKESAYEAAGLDGAITIETISALVGSENFSMPVGKINDDGVAYAVKVGDVFSDGGELESWELFNIEAGDIGVIKLSDIARIEYLDNSDSMYARVNGNDGILLSIDKQSTYSTTDVAHNVEKTVKELEKKYEGLHIAALSDQGDYIDLVIQSVLQSLFMGGALAILILLIFLKAFRPTLIIAISIPASLLFAMVLMYFTGVSLNIISLAGLALGVGMLVDNSIVVVENIYRLKAEGLPIKDACIDGAKQVGGAIIASTLTTVSVFLPIVFTTGITKQIFSDMGLTIAYSLVASLIVALTLVPALSSLMLKKTRERKRGLFDRITDGYAKLLDRSLSKKAFVFALTIALFGLSIFGVFQMGTEFIPESDSKQMSMTLEMPKGKTAQDARAMCEEIIERIADIDDIETIAAMQGSSGMLSMMSTMGSEDAVAIYMLLKENRRLSSQDVAKEIKARTEDLDCTLTIEATTMNMSMLTGDGVSISVRGTSLDDLQTAANDIGEMLKGIEGTENVTTGLEETTDEIRITVDKNAAMAKGYTVAQIYMKVAQAVKSEQTATTLQTGSDTVTVVVAQSEDKSLTIDGLKNLELAPVSLTGGTTSAAQETFAGQSSMQSDGAGNSDETFLLSDIAEISFKQAPKSISHRDGVRTMTVTAGIDADHNIGKISDEVKKRLSSYEFPGDTYYVEDGENEFITTALKDLIYMILVSVALIYMIMVAQFQSLKSPFIVMFTIPLAFTGGLLLLWVLRFNLSVIAMLGLLVLSGVVVNNGIVFVDYANQLVEGGMSVREAMTETGRARIRPIIMTAITTILGLTTIALAIGEGTDMVQPMAIVVIGGLAYATLLTLFVIPALYEVFHSKKAVGSRQ